MMGFKGYRAAPPAEYVKKGIAAENGMPDYEGVVFADGSVAVRWTTKFRSTSVWSDWNSFYQVHGHPEYGTVIKFYNVTEKVKA